MEEFGDSDARHELPLHFAAHWVLSSHFLVREVLCKFASDIYLPVLDLLCYGLELLPIVGS